MDTKRRLIKPEKYIVAKTQDFPDNWTVYASFLDLQIPPRMLSLDINYYDDGRGYKFTSVPQLYPYAFPFGASLKQRAQDDQMVSTENCIGGFQISQSYQAENIEEACNKFFRRYGFRYEIETING